MDSKQIKGPACLRVIVYAPHFAEYSLRLAIGLAETCWVIVIVERDNLEQEVDGDLLKEAKSKTLWLLSFSSRSDAKKDRITIDKTIPFLTKIFRPHIVHFQEQGDPLTVKYLTACAGLKTVLTVHDPRPHSGNDDGFAKRVQLTLDYLRSHVSAIHVHGAYCERVMRENGSKVAICSTPHGVLFVPPERPQELGCAANLLFWGRMEAYKGLEVFLNSLNILRERGVSFQATIAGKGSELDRLSGALNKSDILVEPIFLPAERVRELLADSLFVVVPYLDATQSGVVASAFANGRTVIASNVGGLADAVEDETTGLLIPPGDPIALADAIERLLNDRETLMALSHNAKQRADGDLNWSRIAQTLVSFYRDVLIT
ncbi:MAG: glycosyltransferase [Beijerinckiaceae bacterium]|nr:MAG: glycosyltransferase [Beijerinckiaceae bacterium]